MTRKEALALPAGKELDALVLGVPWIKARGGHIAAPEASTSFLDAWWILETWRLLSRSVCLNDAPAESWTRYHTELQSFDPRNELKNAWFVGLWKVNDGIRREADAIGHDAIGFGSTLPLAVARASVCTTLERDEVAA